VCVCVTLCVCVCVCVFVLVCWCADVLVRMCARVLVRSGGGHLQFGSLTLSLNPISTIKKSFCRYCHLFLSQRGGA
jgi:hypothetical protein